MRKMLMGVAIWMCGFVAVAAPVSTINPEDGGDVSVWRKKTNTEVSAVNEGAKDGAAALRFTITPGEFNFGWVHTPIPEADYSKAVAIHGFVRMPEGTAKNVDMSVMVVTPGDKPTYFTSRVATFDAAGNDWKEFLAPIADLEQKGGPVQTLDMTAIKKNDLLQFLVGGVDAKTVVDLDGLAFLNAEDFEAAKKNMKP